MAYDEFFTDSDKPYAENLNDSLMLIDAFDVTVPCSMPTMFSNGEFNSTVNVTRKCGVALVTLKSAGSGVTVGTSSISGTGDVVFRVYPNFNSFYKWSKILLEKSGTVSIAFYKTDGTSISATVGADGTISENSALKQLQEIDVVLTLSNASISNVLIEFINNQTSRTRTGALLEASQLVNVNGTVVAGDGKAVSGDTVKTALDNLQSSINEDIEDLSDVVDTKEDSANKVTSLDSNDNHYPSSKAVKTVTDALNSNKENVSNKVTSLDNSDTHYPSSKAVKTVTDAKENSSNKVTTLDNSDTHYPSTSAIYPIIQVLGELINASISATHSKFGNTFKVTGTVTSNINGLVFRYTIWADGSSHSVDTTIEKEYSFELGSFTTTTTLTIQVILPFTGTVLVTKKYNFNGEVTS